MNCLGQEDTIYKSVTLPKYQYEKLLQADIQNALCDTIIDSLGFVIIQQDRAMNKCDQVINELEGQHIADSLGLIQKDDIIDIADKETRKQKKQKFLFGGIGLVGIILLLL